METLVHQDMSDMVQDSVIYTDTATSDVNTHTFTLKSGATQDIYVSVHTWPARSYPHTCQVTPQNRQKVIMRGLLNENGVETLWSFD